MKILLKNKILKTINLTLPELILRLNSKISLIQLEKFNSKSTLQQSQVLNSSKIFGRVQILNKCFNSINKCFSTSESSSQMKNTVSHSKRKIVKIVPIKLTECLMPYGKNIKVSKTDELSFILSALKSDDVQYCVFVHDKKKNKTSNIGVRCSSVHLVANGEEVSFNSQEGDSRVYADTSSENFFKVWTTPENNQDSIFYESNASNSSNTINLNKNMSKTAENNTPTSNNNSTSANSESNSNNNNINSNSNNAVLGYRQAFEFSDEKDTSEMFSDFEIVKNLLNDINKVIFTFYEVTSKHVVDQMILKEANSAIIYLQNILKTNMDFIQSLSNKTFFSYEDEMEIERMLSKKASVNKQSTDTAKDEQNGSNSNSNLKEEDVKQKPNQELSNSKESEGNNAINDMKRLGQDKNPHEKSLFELLNNRDFDEDKLIEELLEENENDFNIISERSKEGGFSKQTAKSLDDVKLDYYNKKRSLQSSVEGKDEESPANNKSEGKRKKQKQDESAFEEKIREQYEARNAQYDKSNKSNIMFDYHSGKQLTRKKFLLEVNNVVFDNIHEFMKIIRGFRRSFPFKEVNMLIENQDPFSRIKQLIELIYELGDFIIKDLHMQDEYKKDVMQKQEKYLLKFVKKQVDKLSSGESADIYNKKLEALFSNGEVNEQVKRSIQLEIEQAFNTSISNNEGEFEDRKKFLILEDIFSFPWDKRQEVIFDVKYTENVLDSDLYGLQKVKERIYEYIAKLKRTHGILESELSKAATESEQSQSQSKSEVTTNNGESAKLSQTIKKRKNKGFVILITGPPGTGKTTIAQLIGKALQRKTGLINLSGETDTINLKGSRRTYIDSQPSIFFKEMVKLGVKNPVIILDEIDKIADRGDRTSHSSSPALLELLNPEENHNFIDQYLNIPLDFSETIFICTSNYNVNLLEPLLDRMEVIEVDDYTFKEKKEIAERYLIPKLLKDYGLYSMNSLIQNRNTIDILSNANTNSSFSSSTSNNQSQVANNESAVEKPIATTNSGINNLNAIQQQKANTVSNNEAATTDNTVVESSSSSIKNDKIEIIFPYSIIEEIIREYTNQATGCRGIKRTLEKIIRKINIDLLIDKTLQSQLILSNHSSLLTNKHFNTSLLPIHQVLLVDIKLVDKYLASHKYSDSNLLKLIKEHKSGYLVSDGYGNIGRMLIKQRPIELIENNKGNREQELNKILSNTTTKDIYKHLDIVSKLSKPVKEALETAIILSRKKICKMLLANAPLELDNLVRPYSLYMTYPYQEKEGNTFGLAMFIALVANIFDYYPCHENILILGELNPKGHILKVVNLKYILNSCEFYGIKKLILPEGTSFILFI